LSSKPKPIPAQAGIHGSDAREADEWTPAFAGVELNAGQSRRARLPCPLEPKKTDAQPGAGRIHGSDAREADEWTPAFAGVELNAGQSRRARLPCPLEPKKTDAHPGAGRDPRFGRVKS